MKIVICDDNQADAVILRDYLLEHPIVNSDNIYVYRDSSHMVSEIQKGLRFDIAFLDIDMPDFNGIEVGKIIRQNIKNAFIVFTTNYPQYAIEAFDCEAFQYLIKPVDKNKLYAVIDRIYKKHLEEHAYHIIKKRTETIRLPIKDISFVECCNKHIIYHLKTKNYETNETLSDVYNKLSGYGFYQIHQGYIVNMNHIDHFESYYVVLKDNTKVNVSVRKRAEVMVAYAKFAGEFA